MKFEITSGIPLPRGKGKPRKYDIPLSTMESLTTFFKRVRLKLV